MYGTTLGGEIDLGNDVNKTPRIVQPLVRHNRAGSARQAESSPKFCRMEETCLNNCTWDLWLFRGLLLALSTKAMKILLFSFRCEGSMKSLTCMGGRMNPELGTFQT